MQYSSDIQSLPASWRRLCTGALRLWLAATACGFALSLLPARADDYKEPDLSKFKPEDGQISLEVWTWVGGVDKLALEFEKLYPNIKVHVDNVGGGPTEYTKLQTALRAGSGAPDVVHIEYDFLPSFIVTDGLADMSKYNANDVKSYFVPWTWAQVSPDGKAVYGIPWDSGPLAYMYNKKIFDQYGITVPTTWDEFAAQAEKLSKATNGKVKMADFYVNSAPWYIGLVWACGGKFFKANGDSWSQTINSPIAEKVLTYWDGLVKKGYVGKTTGFTAEWYNAVTSGEFAGSIEAAWGPGVIAHSVNDKTSGEWRIAPLPQWEKGGKFQAGNWGGSLLAVTKQCKYPKAATLFAIWLNACKAPVIADWNTYALFPAALAGLAAPELNQPDKNPSKFCGGQNVAEVYSQASSAVNVDFDWTPWFAFVNDNYNKHIDDLFNGRASVKQALDAWQEDSLKNAKDNGYDVKAQ